MCMIFCIYVSMCRCFPGLYASCMHYGEFLFISKANGSWIFRVYVYSFFFIFVIFPVCLVLTRSYCMAEISRPGLFLLQYETFLYPFFFLVVVCLDSVFVELGIWAVFRMVFCLSTSDCEYVHVVFAFCLLLLFLLYVCLWFVIWFPFFGLFLLFMFLLC